MPLHEFSHQSDALFRGNIRKPNKACVRHVMKKDEFPEVGIDRYQYPVFRCRAPQ